MISFHNEWDSILKDEFQKEYYQHLRRFLIYEYTHASVYPPKENIYEALRLTDYGKVKVVILGQDPYHGPGQAHGLAFSVPAAQKIPPSLVNIYKEIERDCQVRMGQSGNLESWARQGVLLLNAVLTVRAGLPRSHANQGWETFTNNVLALLNQQNRPIVFLLWGNDAKAKQFLLTNPNHLILTAPHPSPLSAYQGFFGCSHFSKANAFLISHSQEPIDWRIE